MKTDAKIIASKVSDKRMRPIWNDMELMAITIAEAAPLDFLIQYGYQGLWEAASQLRLFPRERHQLIEHLKLVKIEDLIRKKAPQVAPVQQEIFV